MTDHVTFADLYSHRSGLPGGFGNQLETMGYTRDEILSRLQHIPLNPFRASYSYSNFGMTAAGDAAAKADGKSFEDMVQEQLFGPAGMTETSASYDDFLAVTTGRPSTPRSTASGCSGRPASRMRRRRPAACRRR